jgi:iron complex outermembrane recepter protein
MANSGVALRLALMVGAALVSPGALAQSGQPPEAEGGAAGEGLADIVVTAERRESNLQDTPISVTAVTSSDIAARGVAVINDLAAYVPNLTSTTGPQGSADANFFIRGIGQFDFIVTNDPGVGLYVDGVYIGRTVGAMLDAADIERVEVLRGPQGTLFGRNTLGGAVNITFRPPDASEFSGFATATYGSRDRIDLNAAVNVPLGGENAFRVSGFYREQDGFARRFDGLRFGRIDRHGVRGALHLEPTENIRIDLTADYSKDTSNPVPSVLLAIAPFPFFPPAAAADIQDPNRFYRVNASNLPSARNEVYGFSGTIAVDLGENATFKSITAYRNLDGFSTSDPDGTRFRLYDQNTDTDQNQFSQELQIAGDAFGDRLNYLIGAFYFRERARQELRLCFAPISNSTFTPFGPCNTWTQGNNQKTESFAIFGQGRVKLTDTFSVTLGGRYTWDEKDIVSNQFFDFRQDAVGPGAVFGFGFPPALLGQRIVVPIVSNLPDSASFERFTPKVGVEYNNQNGLLLFASYSKGFRAGGFNGRLIRPQTSVPSYAPDTNDAYEAGFKSELFGNRVRLNGTVFYQKYKGIQQTIADPAIQFRVANAGDARLYGFELELNAAPIEGLRIDAALGYTNSEFQDVPVTVGPINGNRLPFAPKWTGSVSVDYAIPLGTGGTLTPHVDWRVQSRTFFSPFNLPFEQQGPLGLWNGRLTWQDSSKRFSLSVYGLNLTDEEYYTFGQNALGAQGVAYSYLGRPREFGVTAGVSF